MTEPTYTVFLPSMQTGAPAQRRPSALEEINSFRQYHRVPVVAAYAGLTTSAQLYAEDMRDRSAFGHAADWLQRIIPHYPDWHALAELLAAGYPDAASAMLGLYRSPSHGAAMLSDMYDEVGVGYAQGGTRYGHWWCVHFGSRK